MRNSNSGQRRDERRRRDRNSNGAPRESLRVLIVSQYYWPEVGAPQARLREFAFKWTQAGAQVTVLTGMPNHPSGLIPDEYKGALRRVEFDGATRVVRTWVYATPNEGFVKKTISHLSFSLSSVLLGVRSAGHQDVVMVSSPTFFSIGSAWVIARMHRAKFVVEVRDLWPAIFVDLGVLKNRRIIQILEKLEMAAYRSANAVVVVTQGFKDNIAGRGLDPTKIITIPNGADLGFLTARPPDASVRRELGAREDECLVLYIGAHGISQGLDTIIDAADQLRDEPVRFAFVGEGADKKRLLKIVHDKGLPNVTMLPAVPREAIPELVAAADVCLVPLRDVPLFSSFLPSKMFEFLAMERAVVGSVAGEAARILTASGAVVVQPESSQEVALAVMALAKDPERRRRMGRDGRAYVSANYNRDVIAAGYLALLHSLQGKQD